MHESVGRHLEVIKIKKTAYLPTYNINNIVVDCLEAIFDSGWLLNCKLMN